MEPEFDFDYYLGLATSSFADMLHDDERNQKFGLALKKAIDKVHARGDKAHVLDIGTGTGLLSMLAVTHGADTVIACEMFEPVADCAAKIIEANGFSDKIKLINKHSLNLTVGADCDLPHRANILVSEVFDTELIGEGAIATFNHAHSMLLEENSISIPSLGTIYGQIIESPSLLRWHRLQEWSHDDELLVGIPLGMKICPGTPALFDFQLSQLPEKEFVALTEKIPLFKFDFMRCKKLPRLQYETFNCTVLKKGKAHAVLIWWDLVMDDEGDIILSCAPVWHHPNGPQVIPDGNPAMDIPWRDHWMQSAYFFREENEICRQTTLRAWHDEFSYWFSLCQCGSRSKDDCRCVSEELPACDCSLHMVASRTRIAAMNCAKRRSILLQLAQRLIKLKKIFLVFGDFSLLGLLLSKMGAKQVYIIMSNATSASQRVHKAFIEANDCDQVTVSSLSVAVDRLRNEITRDPELKEQVCLISEPFFETTILPWDNVKFTLEFENFFNSTKSFLERKDVMVCPEGFEIQACCVTFDDMWKISRPLGKCMGFDVSIFDELISGAKKLAIASPEAQPLWEYPCKALSDPVAILRCRTSQLNETTKNEINLKPIQRSPVDGIAFWIEYTLMPELKIATGPVNRPEIGKYIIWDRCERQGVHLYDVATYEPSLPCKIEFDPSTASFSFNFDFDKS